MAAPAANSGRGHDSNSGLTAHDSADSLQNGLHTDTTGTNGADPHSHRTSTDTSSNASLSNLTTPGQGTKKGGAKKKVVDPNEVGRARALCDSRCSCCRY